MFGTNSVILETELLCGTNVFGRVVILKLSQLDKLFYII